MRAIGICMLGVAICACGDGSGATFAADSQASSSRLLDDVHPYPNYSSENYSDLNKWLCHPELETGNVCLNNLDARVVAADGSFTINVYEHNNEAPVDCLYFLPTTSLDPTPNADFIPDVQELKTAEVQFGPYGEACRQYAPLYRQVTLTTLAVNVVTGQLLPFSHSEGARDIAYGDVLDAYRHYMANDNAGRGYILVGHSQGAGHLRRLIAEEIEPVDYLYKRMVSAHLMGATVAVPHDAVVGGSFVRTPVCEDLRQFNCVVSYASYRRGDPELADPRFATTDNEQTRAVCTDLASLMGRDGELDAYFPYNLPPAYGVLAGLYNRGTGGPYSDRFQNVIDSMSTSYFKVPGQIYGGCVFDVESGAHYLEVKIIADAADPRADDYPAEFRGGTGWGMHLADMNLALSDLVQLSHTQSSSWLEAAANP